MDAAAFNSLFTECVRLLSELSRHLDEDPTLVGSLSVEDYVLLGNLIKEYAWARG